MSSCRHDGLSLLPLKLVTGLLPLLLARARVGETKIDDMVGFCDEASALEVENASVLLMTISMPSDILPIDVMLLHQMKNLGGPSARVEVLLDVDAQWPRSGMLDSTAVLQLRNAGVRFVCQNFTRRARESSDPLLHLIGHNRPHRLSDFYAGVDIEHLKSHFTSNTVGMLSFLERCAGSQFKYCVWLDSDIFLHRGSQNIGWLDSATTLFDRYSRAAGVMAPAPYHPSSSLDCRSTVRLGNQISQRYFVLHRERLLQSLPLEPHSCAPACDGFESSIFLFPWKARLPESRVDWQPDKKAHRAAELIRGAAEIAETGEPKPWKLAAEDRVAGRRAAGVRGAHGFQTLSPVSRELQRTHQQFLAPPGERRHAEVFLHMPCATSREPWALHPPDVRKHLLSIFRPCLDPGVHPGWTDTQAFRRWPAMRKPLGKLLARIDAEGALGPVTKDGQSMANSGWSCLRQSHV
mmetsp:Transcript_162661/g.300134  ORF Transcript_162661/g.300134 Transcript_162661/m.300134 type:complete len:465 (-) Transcript_162661:51-1445(-)